MSCGMEDPRKKINGNTSMVSTNGKGYAPFAMVRKFEVSMLSKMTEC